MNVSKTFKKVGEIAAFTLLAFLVFNGVFADIALAQAVTSPSDFMGSADISIIGELPYYLGLLALILAPLAAHAVEKIKQPPEWLSILLPSLLSLTSACVTALAMGFLPWEPQGINMVIVMMLGGVGGQGVVLGNRKRVKNGKVFNPAA